MTAIDPNSITPGSLNVLPPCPTWIQATVCLFIPMYFAAFNYLPVILAMLPFLGCSCQLCLGLLVAIISMCLFVASFSKICNRILSDDAEKIRLSKVNPIIQEFHLEHQYQREQLTNAYFAKKVQPCIATATRSLHALPSTSAISSASPSSLTYSPSSCSTMATNGCHRLEQRLHEQISMCDADESNWVLVCSTFFQPKSLSKWTSQ